MSQNVFQFRFSYRLGRVYLLIQKGHKNCPGVWPPDLCYYLLSFICELHMTTLHDDWYKRRLNVPREY